MRWATPEDRQILALANRVYLDPSLARACILCNALITFDTVEARNNPKIFLVCPQCGAYNLSHDDEDVKQSAWDLANTVYETLPPFGQKTPPK